jgi:hypothetical protein
MFSLSDEVRNLDLLKESMSLVEVGRHYRKNESSNCSTAQTSIRPEHLQVFLNSSLNHLPTETKGLLYL